MPRSDIGLRLLSFGIAGALFLVVRGERRVSTSVSVPLEARLPAGLELGSPLPSHFTVMISGPWARLRGLTGQEIGPVTIDLSRTGPGFATWYVRSESMHLPQGVRVESLYPSQGTVDLLRDSPSAPSP